MSHEIRTPIAGIIGLGELLSESPLTTEQKELSSAMQQSATFLLTLINDILDFSKIEAGHMDIEAVPFRPSRLINDLRALMRLPAQERGIDLVCHNMLTDDMSIVGDPGRLRQVLTNLLSNSIKFTQKGSVTLTVTVASEEILTEKKARVLEETNSPQALDVSGSSPLVDLANAAQAVIEKVPIQISSPQDRQDDLDGRIVLQFVVEDTGLGISKEAMGKLFQPFNQADSSTARKHGGTGLGLSISRQLTELMGGNISLTSEPGMGTKATVLIPYRRSPARQAGLEPRGSSSSVTTIADLRNRDAGVAGATSPQSSQKTSLLDKTSLSPTSPGPSFKPLDAIKPPIKNNGRSSIHILVVEDNPVNQKIAIANIRKLGYSVTAVWNGEEALAYLTPSVAPTNENTNPNANITNPNSNPNSNSNSNPNPDPNSMPSLILMDCMMPVMDGYQATQALRHDLSRFDAGVRAIPIVAMTASAIQGDREKCEQAGMDDYLTKPVNKDTLERVVQKWVVKEKGGP